MVHLVLARMRVHQIYSEWNSDMDQSFTLTLQFSILMFIALILGCTNPPSIVSRQPSYALKSVSHTTLARSYKKEIDRHKRLSGFVLLGSGLDAFAARTELFGKAEKSIDVQYYLVRNDLTGHLFYQSLQAAANRGVRVRILLDDQYIAKQPSGLATLDQHPNIELRVFNPYSRKAPRLLQYIFRLGEITRRMHNKSVIIDNAVTILGSRNIGNEYSEARSKQVFSGMEALAIGPIVKDVSASFDRYWNFPKTIKVSQLSRPGRYNPQLEIKRLSKDPMTIAFSRALKTSPLVKQVKQKALPFRWAKAHLIVDAPTKIIQPRNKRGEFLNGTQFQPYIQNTDKELLIITPYFIPGKEGIRFFKQLRDRGIEVSVLTNSYASTDVEFVNAHYNKYRKNLLKMGVNLYEFKSSNGSIDLLKRASRRIRRTTVQNVKAGLHAKIFNFDRRNLYIGSMNLDPRSLYENTEIGVMITSTEINKTITKWFDENSDALAYHLRLENNKIVWEDFSNTRKTHRVEPDTALSQRLLMNLMRLIPVEPQL